MRPRIVPRFSRTQIRMHGHILAGVTVTALLLCDGFRTPLLAQGPQIGIGRIVAAPSELGLLPLTAVDVSALETARPKDHRFLGLAVGGVVLGTAGALLVRWACVNYSPDPPGSSCAPQTLAGGAVGAVVGGMLGYLVGLGIRAGGDAP